MTQHRPALLRPASVLLARRSALVALGITALLGSLPAHALDLDQLAAQLSSVPLVHGKFVQEKHLRGLPKPLLSQGRFVLERAHGMLWLMETPVKQDYRIVPAGIEQRTPEGWKPIRQQAGMAQQSRLFTAVLQGDRSALERDFSLTLSTPASGWQLDLVPKSALLKQIFTSIKITGTKYVERIEMSETQGDSTVVRMVDSNASQPLTAQEKDDLGL
ncbi:outer membrane lipoprotein carrier protein LolA [Pigmentiphaga aceris]|uniref:Outer membrane lipoprotein carrier protein LolA n=1 Tax=Pigmentiphaga aceris TaxID=1940612 RepID=A0A5C0B199_9BURK|nr:outer membrane lipoprotein carrier protein LolA [Pigmentiphaga aceris]QEI07634.1 outer membrane lipoprotein carrier protein LolA [Pigmentiphaga aceris]